MAVLQAQPTPEMGLLDHLRELRNRLFMAMLALALTTAAAMFVTEPILRFLQEPYGREFTVLGPTGGVVAYFRVAVTAGAILASPVITYQVLMFVLPGLTWREKKMVFFALPPLALLFVIGVLFSWFILIPPALGFLEGFQPTLFRPEWTADLYLSFVTTLVFWMGVAFEMPLIFFVLAAMGFVTRKQLIEHWRVAVIIATVAAALITPTVDPVNMALVIVPLLLLYLFSIVMTGIGGRVKRRTEQLG